MPALACLLRRPFPEEATGRGVSVSFAVYNVVPVNVVPLPGPETVLGQGTEGEACVLLFYRVDDLVSGGHVLRRVCLDYVQEKRQGFEEEGVAGEAVTEGIGESIVLDIGESTASEAESECMLQRLLPTALLHDCGEFVNRSVHVGRAMRRWFGQIVSGGEGFDGD